MAEVYRSDNSPYWRCDFSVGGKRVRKSTKRTNKKDAQRVANEWEREALEKHQLGEEQPELTMSEALGFYLDKHASSDRCNASVRVDKVLGRISGIEGFSPDLPFHKLTSTELLRYQQRRKAQGAAHNTINHEINAISAAYHIVRADYRVRSGLKFPRFRIEATPRPLMDHEVQQLLSELDPSKPLRGRNGTSYQPSEGLSHIPNIQVMRQQNWDLVQALLASGCRLGEMTSVLWEHVSPDFQSIQIFRTKNKDKASTAKGRHLRLTCTETLAEILKRRYETRGNNPYVFPKWKITEKGRWLREKAPQKSTAAIRKAMNSIGINSPENVERWGRRDVRSLRDTFATRLRRKGLPLDRLQQLLGHSGITMTMKYADTDADQWSQDAAGLLADFEA